MPVNSTVDLYNSNPEIKNYQHTNLYKVDTTTP